MKITEKKDLEIFQDQVRRWGEHNFGIVDGWMPLVGMMEELGELSHAHLKHAQNIRGMADPTIFKAAAADAIGDLMVYLAHYCATQGINLHHAVDTTWQKVRQRDWRKDPDRGGESD